MSRRNVIAFAVGPIIAGAISALIVPASTWFFSAEDIGRIAVFQTTSMLVLLVSSLGMDQAYVREYTNQKNKLTLFWECFAPTMFALCAFIALAIGLGEELMDMLYSLQQPFILTLSIVGIILTTTNRFLGLISRMEGNGTRFSASQISNKVIGLLGVLVFGSALERVDFFWLLSATLLGLASSAIVLAKPLFRTTISDLRNVRIGHTLGFLHYSYPNIGTGLCIWGIGSIPIYVLGSKSFESLGLFSTALALAGPAAILQTVFSTLWIPFAFKWIDNKGSSRAFEKIQIGLTNSVCLFACIACSFLLFSDLFLPPIYAEVQYLAGVCLLAPILYTLSEINGIGGHAIRRPVLTLMSAALGLGIALLSTTSLSGRSLTAQVLAYFLGYYLFFISRSELSSFYWRARERLQQYFAPTLVSITAWGILLISPSRTNALYCWAFTFAILVYFAKPRQSLTEIRCMLRFMRLNR